MGGWIVPPLISKAGKVTIDVKPKNGLNKIDYDKFKIVTTHALFIKGHEEATELLDMTIQPEKLKNYDIFLAEDKFFDSYYYPSVFVQEKHKSEIDDKVNQNYIRTYNYGLTKQTKGSEPKKHKRTNKRTNKRSNRNKRK